MNNFSILSATGGYQYEDMFGGTGGGGVVHMHMHIPKFLTIKRKLLQYLAFSPTLQLCYNK